MLDDEEIPKTEDITYLIEGVPKAEQKEEKKATPGTPRG